MNPNSFPLIGDKLPTLTVQTTHGTRKLPDNYVGKWLVLFSHPGDFTPVCTTEFVSFAKKHHEFEDLNCELLGLSIDQVFSHMKWAEWIESNLGVKIPFPIIADATGSISNALGMIHQGKASDTVRAVFIVDPDSVIRLILFYPQEVGRNVKEIIRTIKALQISDKKKVAIPANWPENEFLGDRVIIPPAKDFATAEKRLKEYEHFDWWFCHTSLN